MIRKETRRSGELFITMFVETLVDASPNDRTLPLTADGKLHLMINLAGHRTSGRGAPQSCDVHV